MTWRIPSVLVWSALAVSAAPGAVRGQVIKLTVRDTLDQPVSNAVIVVARPDSEIRARGLTNRDGQLVLTLRSGGLYGVLIRRLGFTPVRLDSLRLATSDTILRNVRLHAIPQFLAPVAIRSERETIRNATFSGMKIGSLGATVITPSQVDVALPGATDYTDLVSRNPGAGFGVDYQRKCVVSNRGDPPMCLPVIVDGLLLSNVNDAIPPEIVDYMLIVRGNEIGVLYGSIGEGGAVIIFTKRGLRRGPTRE